ncbi:phage protein NinX family protein [Cupriavidus nantongensis]|uniref:phage protein NinX family protein n=1 Tax=Cupriavidus nantongensis TaxID=1796606 RepID=UPI00358F3F46
MKVSELEGALLDLWVAIAEGERQAPEHLAPDPDTGRYWMQQGSYGSVKECPRYSSDWAAGGPIIERDEIFLNPPGAVHYNGGPNNGWKVYGHWRATVSASTRTLPPRNEIQEALNVRPVGRGAGATVLVAAMRAKVASHYGEEVPEVAHG